jgi:curved DNA-binding protein CbpA
MHKHFNTSAYGSGDFSITDSASASLEYPESLVDHPKSAQLPVSQRQSFQVTLSASCQDSITLSSDLLLFSSTASFLWLSHSLSLPCSIRNKPIRLDRMSNLERYYRVLGLKPGASLEEVNQAYRQLAFQWHPDRLPKDNPSLQAEAQEKLKELNQARDELRSRPPTPPPRSDRYGDRARNDRHSGQTRSDQTRSDQTRSDQTRSNQAKSDQTRSDQTRSDRPSTKPNPSAQTVPPRYYYYQAPKSEPSRAAASPPQSPPAPPASAPPAPPAPPRPASSPSNFASWQQPPQQSPQPAPANRKSDPDLSGVDLQGADLRERDLSGRNLSQANLSSANLSDAFLHKINLSGANLANANLFRANLLQANLRNANLQGANLIGADLSGADLSGANLQGSKMGFSDRIMVKLTGAILTGVIMPDGSVHP